MMYAKTIVLFVVLAALTVGLVLVGALLVKPPDCPADTKAHHIDPSLCSVGAR
jgi:hypothetical protein